MQLKRYRGEGTEAIHLILFKSELKYEKRYAERENKFVGNAGDKIIKIK